MKNMFRSSIKRISMEHDDNIVVEVFERLVLVLMDKKLFSHNELLNLVYACTGWRTLTGTEIQVACQKIPKGANAKDRRYIQFHTCFNQMDLPIEYMHGLNDEQLVLYVKESVNLALQNGFAMT